MQLEQKIKEYALDIGFDRVGFTPADPFPLLQKELAARDSSYRWITEGALPIDKTADPRYVLPSARSLIVVLWDYYKRSFPTQLLGKAGKSYLSRPYVQKNRAFGAMFRLLRDFIQQQGMQVGMRPCMPDRQAAARAGLGNFGRNTFIYAPGIGSYVAIITIAVDRELDSTIANVESHCPEDCRACIDACPTGALYEPFRMNPLQCIAFHTYATGNWPMAPADIPTEIREKMGTWIYGCDVCQDACPRNQKKLNAKLPPDAYLKEIAPEISLSSLVNMDDEFYINRVQPLLYGYVWDKKIFQRNAAIALGNTGDSEAVPELKKALSDPEEEVRGYAAWALGQIGGKAAREALEAQVKKENSPKVLEEINKVRGHTSNEC